MTRVIARLILCLVAMFSAPVIYIITVVFLSESSFVITGDDVFGVTSYITVMSFTIIWLALWLGNIKWTRVRISQTIGIWLASILLATVIGGVIRVFTYIDEIGWICGSMIWWLAWLTGSTLIWRESKTERLNRLKSMGTNAMACPSCGYNLTGLHEAKCPECGSQFTLDQLLASINEQRTDIN